MQAYQQIVASATKLLLPHPVGQKAHIASLWNKVEFRAKTENQTENDASLHPAEDAISLYPSILSKTPAQADTLVLREFGELLLRKSGAHGNERWQGKLMLPRDEQIAAVQERLNSPETRVKCNTYGDFVTTFSSAMDRLVALNITNALLANGMPFESAVGLKLTEWGPTAEYASRRKYHSIIPFTSAYATRYIHTEFGSAFSEMIVNKMRSVREKSTALALELLIREICELAR